MSDLPKELLFTEAHEWIRVMEDGSAVIGITNYAQESLGDITFVEFPDEGSVMEKGDSFGVVESVKAASDLYMPVSGEVIAINEDVDASPELLNQSPYGDGWLLKITVSDRTQLDALLSPEAYSELI